jgi:hypothetical protein
MPPLPIRFTTTIVIHTVPLQNTVSPNGFIIHVRYSREVWLQLTSSGEQDHSRDIPSVLRGFIWSASSFQKWYFPSFLRYLPLLLTRHMHILHLIYFFIVRFFLSFIFFPFLLHFRPFFCSLFLIFPLTVSADFPERRKFWAIFLKTSTYCNC